MIAKFFKYVIAAVGILLLIVFSQTEPGRRIYYKLRGGAYSVVNPQGAGSRKGNYGAASQCRANLREIERAKRKAADLKDMTAGYLTVQEVEAALGHKIPRCPAGGSYTVGPLVQLPACSISTQANLDPKDDHFLESY